MAVSHCRPLVFFVGIDRVVLDADSLRVATYGYDAVGTMHSFPFDLVDAIVDILAATVVFGAVNMNHKRFVGDLRRPLLLPEKSSSRARGLRQILLSSATCGQARRNGSPARTNRRRNEQAAAARIHVNIFRFVFVFFCCFRMRSAFCTRQARVCRQDWRKDTNECQPTENLHF